MCADADVGNTSNATAAETAATTIAVGGVGATPRAGFPNNSAVAAAATTAAAADDGGDRCVAALDATGPSP